MKSLGLLVAAGLLMSSTAFADILTYTAPLSGANENPTNNSPGTGFAIVDIDTVAQTMEVDVTFSGLLGITTASHIHCCIAPGGNAGVATTVPTFTLFPLGVTSGRYDHVFDLTLSSTYNPAFVAANGGTTADAESALLAGLAAGDAYLNIHSMVDPGGEIRGFLTPAPEPAGFPLIAAALGLMAFVMIRRQRRA
jgi:hypothetical protein